MMKDPRTGKRRANPYIQVSNHELKAAGPELKIHLKYTNVDGEMQGPFALDFDPQAQGVSNQRSMIEANQFSWARFQQDKLMFRVFMMRDTSAIEAVHYSLNDEVPKLSMPVPEGKFNATNASDFYLPVDESVKFVSLQVTFTDGTESKVVQIYRE